jgi:hypothetical protein
MDVVVAALRSPYSQGQTEGHVNRLKLLKRQSYGRASFDLLLRSGSSTTPPDCGTAIGQELIFEFRSHPRSTRRSFALGDVQQSVHIHRHMTGHITSDSAVTRLCMQMCYGTGHTTVL